MAEPAANRAPNAGAQGTRSDVTGRATFQVAGKVHTVELVQGDGHPHAPGYTATCPACRLAGKGARMLALYDQQNAFVGFAIPHGWAADELPAALRHGGKRYELTTVITPTTAIYAEAEAARPFHDGDVRHEAARERNKDRE